MMIAVSPWVRDLLSVVIVRVTLHEVSPNAIAIDVAIIIQVKTVESYNAKKN